MGKLGFWLAGMMQPLVAKILIALGFQVVTVVGMTASIDGIKAMFTNYIGQVPAAGLQLAALAGAGEGFGMLFGAMAFRLSLWAIERGTRILGANT